MARLGLSQERTALAAGYDPARFSRILRGLLPEPPDFWDRIDAALAIEARAQQAGEQAAARERKRAAKELGGVA